MRDAAPGLRETINPWGNATWVGKDDVFWSIPYKGHVDFGSFRGTELRDPKDLLEGTGERLRDVKIAHSDGVRAADLIPLIEQAIALDRS